MGRPNSMEPFSNGILPTLQSRSTSGSLKDVAYVVCVWETARARPAAGSARDAAPSVRPAIDRRTCHGVLLHVAPHTAVTASPISIVSISNDSAARLVYAIS